MLTDFQNSFSARVTGKFATTNTYLNIPPHLKYVAALPCETSVFKNRNAQEVIEANCHVSLSHSKHCFEIIVWCKIFIIYFANKKMITRPYKKIPLSTVHNCCKEEKDIAAKCHT